MRQERDLEKIPAESLEIVLAKKFAQAIKDVHSAVMSSGEDDEGGPEKSVVIVHPNGTGVHYSDRDCKTQGSEQFYEFKQLENGGIAVACVFYEYEKLRDNTFDLLRIIGGRIVIKDGILMQSVNPQLIEASLQRLHHIGEKAKEPAIKEPVNSDQLPLALPMNPAVLH